MIGAGSSMASPTVPAGRSLKFQHKSTAFACNNPAKKKAANADLVDPLIQLCLCDRQDPVATSKSMLSSLKAEGRRKALFIGINYFGTSSALRGCVDDAYRMRSFLETQFAFRREETKIMTDEFIYRNTELEPNRANLLRAFQWLVDDAKPGDQLFLHYSGHGGFKKSYSEASGFDQTIYPTDFNSKGPIADWELRPILVDSLPGNCDLMAVFDSCHSGTILNLQYLYNVDGTAVPHGYRPIAQQSGPIKCGRGVNDLVKSMVSFLRQKSVAVKNSTKPATSAAIECASVTMSCRDWDRPERSRQSSPPPDPKTSAVIASYPDVICFSGCEDQQLSIDYCTPGMKCYGVMSQFWMDALAANPNQSYLDLLRNLRRMMVNSRFDQVPVLSSNYQMDMNRTFNLK